MASHIPKEKARRIKSGMWLDETIQSAGMRSGKRRRGQKERERLREGRAQSFVHDRGYVMGTGEHMSAMSMCRTVGMRG